MNKFNCEEFRKRVLTWNGTDYSSRYCDGNSFTSGWTGTLSTTCGTTTTLSGTELISASSILSNPYCTKFDQYSTGLIHDELTKKTYRVFYPELIKNVEFYPPAVKMTFKDGTVTTSVAQGDDEYNPEQGMIMCILQYIFMGKTYNNMFRKWIKADEDRKAAAEKEALAEKEAKEITARQEAKEKKRKAKRAARKREEAIEIQKEAYLRAMKETSNKEEV